MFLESELRCLFCLSFLIIVLGLPAADAKTKMELLGLAFVPNDSVACPKAIQSVGFEPAPLVQSRLTMLADSVDPGTAEQAGS